MVYPAVKEVLYINPLGETQDALQRYKASWRAFITRRFANGLEDSGPSSWSFNTRIHSKQTDSVSCGVLVLKVTKNVVNFFIKGT